MLFTTGETPVPVMNLSNLYWDKKSFFILQYAGLIYLDNCLTIVIIQSV